MIPDTAETQDGHQKLSVPFDFRQALPPEAVKGLELFNAGHYFEAHEELETSWRAEKGPIRDLYRGVLQVGVGYYHVQRGNFRGALKMFRRCRQWLDRFPDQCCGIDLQQLRHDYEDVERLLKENKLLDPASFEFQPVHYTLNLPR